MVNNFRLALTMVLLEVRKDVNSFMMMMMMMMMMMTTTTTTTYKHQKALCSR